MKAVLNESLPTFLATQHVGSQFPNQGLNPYPLQGPKAFLSSTSYWQRNLRKHLP